MGNYRLPSCSFQAHLDRTSLDDPVLYHSAINHSAKNFNHGWTRMHTDFLTTKYTKDTKAKAETLKH
jgi:hypothetical protein